VSNEVLRHNKSESPIVGLYRNKPIYLSVLCASLLFLFVIAMEKTKFFMQIIPKIRGEVSLDNGFVVTSIMESYPFIVKKDDPFVGDQLRFTGSLKSLFSQTANYLCRKHDTVVEIGSHFGYNAVCIGSYLKNNGAYYALEANPKVFNFLRKNVIINDLENTVTVINKAVSDQNKTYAIDDILSSYQNSDGTYGTVKSIIVNSSTLDKELAESNVSLLLIDVPGFEFRILEGARSLLERSPNIKILINIEIKKSDSADILKELNSLSLQGFRFFEVINANKFGEISSENIIKRDQVLIVVCRNDMEGYRQ